MPEILAHTADGTILHFPDGTDPSVIQNTIKQSLASPINSPIRDAKTGLPTNQTPSSWMLGNPNNMTELHNTAIDRLRNIGSPLAGAVGAAAAAPSTGGFGSFATGTAAYTALDTLLKRLKIGDKPSVGEDLTNSAEDALLNEAGGRVIGAGGKTIKALNNMGIPDSGSILRLNPTASQALASTGDHSVATSIMKFLEDHFAGSSKAAAQSESASLGKDIGFKLAAKEAGRASSTVQDPNHMVKLITGELVPEESVGPSKILQRTADYQPIKIVPTGDFIDTSKFGEKGAIPLTQTRVTGPIEQVPIPGGYEILPGVIKKTPFATDPASLDALIKNPDRLQDALTKSQSAGLGYNVRQDMAGYQLARIQQAATTTAADGTMRIDANKAMAALNDPEMITSNKILFKGSNGFSNVQQFYKNLAFTQDKPGTSKILRYANAVALPMSLVHSAISGNLASPLTVVGLELSAAGLAKALTNPQSGRLMLALANREALGVSDSYAARMIMKTLTGTTAYLVDSNGSKSPVQIGQGGELKSVSQ